MFKKHEKEKLKRKVTVMKLNDNIDGIILSGTVKTITESLTIKVQCQTRRKPSIDRSRKHCISKSQVKERIIPRCSRAKCSNKKFCQTKSLRNNRHSRTSRKPNAETNDEMKAGLKKTLSPTSSVEIISVDSSPEKNSFAYDNISSGSLSSFSDDEIETLMESTRKRMKDLDTDWYLLPRRLSPTNGELNKSKDTNLSVSLETLVIQECQEIHTVKSEAYSPMWSPDKQFCALKEHNNNTIELKDSYNNCDLYNSNVKIEKKLVDAVVVKLEKDLKNSPKLENVYDIKQELYSDQNGKI